MTGLPSQPSAPRQHPQAGFAPPPPIITMGEAYYTIFRHKWKIAICAILGMAGAALFLLKFPPPYQSEAKLFIRYVVSDSRAFGPVREDAQTKSPDQQGETIIASEVEILTSLDLARQVAAVIGPERILAEAGGGNDLTQAAAVIQRGLTVKAPERSSVIRTVFTHPDRQVVQPVLREVIDRYLKLHVEVHRSSGMVGDFLTQETDQKRAQLLQTEEELRRSIARAGVISLADAKANYVVQESRLRQEIFSAEAEIAERTGALANVAEGATSSGADDPTRALSRELIEQYRQAKVRQEFLRRRDQELLAQFTPESTRVKEARVMLAEAEKTVAQLESQHPALARLASPTETAARANTFDAPSELTRIAALQSRIKALSLQLEQVRGEAGKLDQLEVGINELRRRQELEEASYRFFSQSLERSRITEALGTGKVANISQIQTPTPPFLDRSKMLKGVVGISLGGILLGLGWAFAIELFLDRSVRRPADIERLGRYPLFITIPKLKAKLLGPGSRNPAMLALPEGQTGGAPAVWDTTHALHAYHETLRDRMISFFDAKGLMHKPKLVAVTSIGTDAGASTTAAGLASSLSRTGDGNVLLVDMTAGQNSAHHFQHGEPVRGLEETLEAKDERIQVQDNLYLAGGAKTDELSRALPRQFTRLMPKLRASDFDYIIFDMPPVSQISITPRLAEYMDMVFMVVESEKTSRESVQRTAEMLSATGTSVGVVLNKNRSYVPSRLEPVALS
jgi:polysaccharide biosynthesis transport protein